MIKGEPEDQNRLLKDLLSKTRSKVIDADKTKLEQAHNTLELLLMDDQRYIKAQELDMVK